jgi:hypothetical protein
MKIASFFLLYGRDAKLSTDSLEEKEELTLVLHLENLIENYL